MVRGLGLLLESPYHKGEGLKISPNFHILYTGFDCNEEIATPLRLNVNQSLTGISLKIVSLVVFIKRIEISFKSC